MFPIRTLLILFSLAVSAHMLSAQTFSGEILRSINASHNDAFEYGNGAQDMELAAFGMNITESWSQQKIGLRFEDIDIPTGSIIKEAYIQFTCKDPEKSMGPSDLTWHGELDDNPAPYAASPGNISQRSLTNESVAWQPEEWRWKEFGGPPARSTNLASIVQEIINQNDWATGQALAFIISGTGTRSAHNFNSGKPATLFISFDAPIPNQAIDQIYINEIAANGTDFPDETGDYEDWVELYNDNNFPVNVGGLYFSDKADEPDRWQISASVAIPAKGFLLLWADDQPDKGGLHTNFSLNKNGETLLLSQRLNNSMITIDEYSYSEIPFKASQGRINEETNNWKTFGVPTPGEPNGSGIDWIAAPEIDIASGHYSSEINITLSHDDPAAVIRFTFDGSDPSIFAPIYSTPISLDKTGTLKARAFKAGAAPSKVESRSYLFELPNNLPVLMISADERDLFDPEQGIYTDGNGAEQVFNCGEWQSANYLQDWERPAHLTFLEKNGDLAFSANAGIKIAGACSRKYALKSLNINLRNNQYGTKNIDYELFEDRAIDNYSRLKLRNSGQDYRATMLRDGVNQIILSAETDLEYQAYRPTAVYLNDEYWGIMNFRERYNQKYFDELYQDDPDYEKAPIDLIKNAEFVREIKEGDDFHFQALHDYILDNDLSQTEHYNYVISQMDINNFIDYWLSVLYISNNDWPANNKLIWRPRTENGKWRWTLIDTDNSTDMTGPDSDQGHRSDKLAKVLEEDVMGWPNDSRSTMIFRKLIKNESFKAEFIQRGCTFAQLLFDPAKAVPIIEEHQAAIADDIENHLTRWAFDNPNLQEKDIWEDNVNKLITYYQERPPYFFDMLKNNFSLGETYDLTIAYDSETKGDVFIHWDERSIPYDYIGTYYQGVPIRLTARPKDGYEFKFWLETGDVNPVLDYTSSANATLTPVFEEDPLDAIKDIDAWPLKLWPNPSSDNLLLESEHSGAASLQISQAATGQEVFRADIDSNQIQLAVKEWPVGIYLLVITDSDGRQVIRKFVKS